MFTNETHFERDWLTGKYTYNIVNDEKMMGEVNDFLKNNQMEVVKSLQEGDGWAVLLKDVVSRETFWIDVWKMADGELTSDWNDFAFSTTNTRDMARKKVMDNADFASWCFGLAEDEIERQI